jgi:predicted transglutaminase-like cysteine proteinase
LCLRLTRGGDAGRGNGHIILVVRVHVGWWVLDREILAEVVRRMDSILGGLADEQLYGRHVKKELGRKLSR